MDWAVENFKFVYTIVWVLSGLVVWALAVTFAKKKDHQQLTDRVSTLEQTYTKDDDHQALAKIVNTLATKIDELPDSKAFNQLDKDISELKGSVDGMSNLLSNISQQVSMLVENEIKGSK